MAIKELILEEIEQIPETKLTEILNFIRTFKQQLKTIESSSPLVFHSMLISKK